MRCLRISIINLLGILVVVCGLTTIAACKNQEEKPKVLAAENTACLMQLNNALTSLVWAFAEGKEYQHLYNNLLVQTIDSGSVNRNTVVTIDFGKGIECLDGFRRSGIWQLQFNHRSANLADSFWLFLQQIHPDSSSINTGIGWKGQQVNVVGIVSWVRFSDKSSRANITVDWKSDQFTMISAVTINSKSDWAGSTEVGFFDEISGKIRYMGEQGLSADIGSNALFHRPLRWKGFESGTLRITDQKSSEIKQYTVDFNPFGAIPAACDEHAKLKIQRIEKMITLW